LESNAAVNALTRLTISDLFLLLLAALLGGCSSTANNLVLVSADHHRNYQQTFSHAYASLNPNGDYDVVLVHDANADSLAGGDGPLQSGPVTPRQVVHIRVFWLAARGSILDHPVASNASIRWYLFGDRPDEAQNLLEYSGSGLVIASDDGKTAYVTIRGATLKATARRGGMTDPLGPSSLNGTIIADVNRSGVDGVLKEVQAADGAVAADANPRD
jgi:hypothetical protein